MKSSAGINYLPSIHYLFRFYRSLDGLVEWRSETDFPLFTERGRTILISVTKGGHMSKPTDLVQGTLDLLILKILALEPLNGWAIGQRLKQVSGEVLQVSDGSLYPALHKLEQEGWITAEWKPSENNRRAKFYSLTRLGRKELEKEAANWNRLSAAISRVVKLKEA
jgi:PadR family transcriptional regulator, regulatory protein PadR